MAFDIDCDQIPSESYNAIMDQGRDAYSKGASLNDNPHIDAESRAAWSEGWQWGSYYAQNKPKH
ncbi:hypothetical protein VIBNISOn1_1840041 [Vibrio nigripulchritudo SOn1]|uniref:Ribosome modulation factor n=1 Tax=Vibrio nigripulchritudo SOn1 TaxID=1238450 RepID=A0AAV2VQE7_9VIBR|nr:hypothetical protein [Vibrio nigripulchritudo]CCO46658.1 hypothetical protein VIBNISOn1_1840041 [Vibrio nigripulchritudo SOn1]